MNKCPELLTTAPLRDYIIGLKSRDRWVSLGEHYAPGFLMGKRRKTVCDVYGVQLAPTPTDLPEEIEHLNQHYFSTDFFGLSAAEGQYIWQSGTPSKLDLPVVWRICGKDFRDLYDGVLSPAGDLPLVDWWWTHPGRRRYERIVIVPRESA